MSPSSSVYCGQYDTMHAYWVRITEGIYLLMTHFSVIGVNQLVRTTMLLENTPDRFLFPSDLLIGL